MKAIFLIGLFVSLFVGVSSIYFGTNTFFEMVTVAFLSWILFNQFVDFMAEEEIAAKKEDERKEELF